MIVVIPLGQIFEATPHRNTVRVLRHTLQITEGTLCHIGQDSVDVHLRRREGGHFRIFGARRGGIHILTLDRHGASRGSILCCTREVLTEDLQHVLDNAVHVLSPG